MCFFCDRIFHCLSGADSAAPGSGSSSCAAAELSGPQDGSCHLSDLVLLVLKCHRFKLKSVHTTRGEQKHAVKSVS